MNARTLREAGQQADRRRWDDRRLQDQLDRIRTAYASCAWNIGTAFPGALPANIKALHDAIHPEGMPADAKAQAVGTGMQQDSDKAEIARLRAEREWQPISTAPTNVRVLVCGQMDGEISGLSHTTRIVGVGIVEGGRITNPDTDYYSVDWRGVEHWMPLPDAPVAALASIKQEGKA